MCRKQQQRTECLSIFRDAILPCYKQIPYDDAEQILSINSTEINCTDSRIDTLISLENFPEDPKNYSAEEKGILNDYLVFIELDIEVENCEHRKDCNQNTEYGSRKKKNCFDEELVGDEEKTN